MFESKEFKNKLAHLEKERVKIWERIVKIEDEIKNTPIFNEKEAKQASKKTAEYKNRASERKQEIENIFTEAKNLVTSISNLTSESKNIHSFLSSKKKDILADISLLQEKNNLLESKLEMIEKVFESHPELEEEVENLSSYLSNASENTSKISALAKGVLDKKRKIDDLFYEIVGYEEEDEFGETHHIEGLKDKLEAQYNDISKGLNDLKKSYKELLETKNKETERLISSWDKKYELLRKKIESLLPNALTAGLSSAYSKKKETEVINYKKLRKQFNLGIIGLILVSLVSIGISVFFIDNGTPFLDVVKLLPDIAAAVLPIYIPVLWFTYSANKKLNLSKRLIEEYTHKEVLGKTFEGLSTQIDNLEKSEMSEKLKLKLLFNILEVSTENPGKLISDYKKSDHPIVEVLNQQSKLDFALQKLEGIPGIKKLNELILKSKAKQIKKTTEKVKDIVDDVEKIIN